MSENPSLTPELIRHALMLVTNLKATLHEHHYDGRVVLEFDDTIRLEVTGLDFCAAAPRECTRVFVEVRTVVGP